MKVFLLRHAPAEYGGPDPDRPLSADGTRIAAQLARFIAGNRYYQFSEIWCSPYLRARQTAEPFIGKGALFAFKRDPLSASGFSLAACLPPAALGLKG